MELKTIGTKVKCLFDGGEDRGVSPVIGVILMVAITVILAAVIGAFVLGLGDSMGDGTAPNSQLAISIEDSDTDGNNDLIVNHRGGESLDPADVTIRVDGNEVDVSSATPISVGEDWTFINNTDFDDGAATPGPVSGSDIEVVIIYEPSDSILFENTFDF